MLHQARPRRGRVCRPARSTTDPGAATPRSRGIGRYCSVCPNGNISVQNDSIIPLIASALPLVTGTVIPAAWPKHRFDVVWTFTRVPGAAAAEYAFGQIPQLLLSGDTDSVISD